MKTTQILLISVLFLIACSSKKEQSTNYVEEEAANEYYEEVAEETAEEAGPSMDMDALKDLPCMSNGEVHVANFYQLTPRQQATVDQEPRYYGNILSYLRYEFNKRINNCRGGEWMDVRTASWNFFPINGGEYRQDLRNDLMPEIEAEFMTVPIPLVEFATENLIPSNEDISVSGYTFQQMYDYYKWEFRKLYFAHVMVSNYSSFEKELRGYAEVANTLVSTPDGPEPRYNYESFMNYINKYTTPEWAYQEGLDVPFGEYFDQYCAFWLRRGLDNSRESLIALQRRVLINYDEEWVIKMDDFTSKLPTQTFDENRIANVIPSEGYLKGDSIISTLPFYKKAENGFLIDFENGESKVFSSAEYFSYYAKGYFPERRLLLVEQESEFTDSFLLDITDGSVYNLGGAIGDLKVSSDQQTFMVQTYTEVGDFVNIYRFKEKGADMIAKSAFWEINLMDWISEKEIQMETGYGGNVFIDISPGL